MRISDWSSDVCSSDLLLHQRVEIGVVLGIAHFSRNCVEALDHLGDRAGALAHILDHCLVGIELRLLRQIADLDPFGGPGLRSEERRVGKEWFSTCGYWWSPKH